MEVLRFVVTLSLLASSMLRVESEEDMTSSITDIPAIYNFGDSNSDTGGIAAAFFPMVAPCGETFFHRPAGRASDGRLIIDFIAERLKLPYLSAYLDSVGTSFQHGANFATGGATIRRQNESWFENGISPFPLDIQVEHYIQFKARTTYLYNKANTETSQRSNLPIPEDFSKALHTFDIGQNDLAVGFRKMNDEQLRAEIPDIVNKFSAAIQQLYQQGARSFWIHNTGPIGCLPINTVNVQNQQPGYLDEHGCIKGWNDVAVEFNKQLKDAVIQLRAELSQAALTHVDVYAAKYGLISNAKNQGFGDPFNICCGHHGNGISVWCGNKANINGTEVYGGSCENPSTVISWDGVHYSEAANFWIANRILNGTGKLKLNTDGSSRGNPGPAGYGGVFREERKHWILGFYGRLDDCTSLEAELWGIFRGLELVQSQGMEALEVDSDSTTAIALINEETPEHSPYLILIKECKALIASTRCSLKHIYREGNKVADKLANMGVDQDHKWVSHIEPPMEIIPLLEADMRGVAFERL